MRVLGMISGTSHDGIDVAVVDFAQDGTTLRGHLTHHGSTPYASRLRADLVAALPPRRITAEDVCALDTRIGQAFGEAARAALAEAPADAVCSHGQTLYHWVTGNTVLGTLQIGQPAWIAQATGLPVVSDLRTADIAAGGQGAPLVPLLDRMLLAPDVQQGLRAGALNLGGIANLTVAAPDSAPAAWDIGPANALIDAVVADSPDTPDGFDRDGRLAASGTVDEALLAELLTEPYYALAPPKSCGKELFDALYVSGYAEKAAGRSGRPPVTELDDLVATLTALTAETVARTVREARLDVLYVSGGGLRNPSLMAAIAGRLDGLTVLPSDALGVPSDAKEALAFALIGWHSLHGLPGNVVACTGASGERVLGQLTLGAAGLMSCDTPPVRPERLVVTGGPA